MLFRKRLCFASIAPIAWLIAINLSVLTFVYFSVIKLQKSLLVQSMFEAISGATRANKEERALA